MEFKIKENKVEVNRIGDENYKEEIEKKMKSIMDKMK
jgi:hypothetical protein